MAVQQIYIIDLLPQFRPVTEKPLTEAFSANYGFTKWLNDILYHCKLEVLQVHDQYHITSMTSF